MPDVLREDRDKVAIVTFNRPDKLNAINAEMQDAIWKAVDDLRDRDDLRVLLIKSTGRYFTAGVDISNQGPPQGGGEGAGPADPLDEQTMLNVRRGYRQLHKRIDEMESIEKPIVMAIHAPCLGLGVEIASSVDFRLAAESAQFGVPEIDIGVIAGSGGLSRFTRLCGVGWSKWLSVAGERIDARTAMMAGFVQAVYPDAEFEQKVWEFCQRLCTRPAEVQGVSKLAVDLAWDLDRTGMRHMDRIINTPLLMKDRSALVAKVLGRGKKK
jgi:enoyl-CoA hydratase/carnithine racemase